MSIQNPMQFTSVEDLLGTVLRAMGSMMSAARGTMAMELVYSTLPFGAPEVRELFESREYPSTCPIPLLEGEDSDFVARVKRLLRSINFDSRDDACMAIAKAALELHEEAAVYHFRTRHRQLAASLCCGC